MKSLINSAHILTERCLLNPANQFKELQQKYMTGSELRQLIEEKWDRPYDIQVAVRGDRRFFQVMWAYLGQASFAFTEEQYDQRLERIAYFLDEWAVSDQVRAFIAKTKEKPRVGKAVSLPLNFS
jgi:Domain of unknown function (DUF3067)